MLVVRQAEPKFRTLWRGRESRAVKIEPCVASAEGSTFLTHRPRPSTQGSIFSARVAEGFDVFLPVYNAAPPVTAPKGSIFWCTVWPGDAGFEFLRARFAPAPEGSKFPSGVASNRKFRKVPCSTIRFPKKLFNSKNLIVGRWRPKAFLTGRGHRRVRFFSARSGLATQGSNFYARESRPRQRVRNLTRKNSNPFSFARQRRPTRRNARTSCFSFREEREKNR